MTDQTVTSDASVGTGLLFGLLGLGGAAVMYLGAGSVAAGYGFGAAILAGVVAILGIHAYAE